jgi:hypothetical protein
MNMGAQPWLNYTEALQFVRNDRYYRTPQAGDVPGRCMQ